MVEWKRCIIFTRYPEPGRTKTRLIPAVGEVGAADLQRRMTERMVRRALVWAARGEARSVQVCFEGGSVVLMSKWMKHAVGDQAVHVGLRPQASGGDLGEKMERALAEAFDEHCARALVVG
ncbi:MAG: TIGR04282 family arsenosugar biosynthesis glycosyltransferase, partial [Candidatus Sumerlaeota bacterium]